MIGRYLHFIYGPRLPKNGRFMSQRFTRDIFGVYRSFGRYAGYYTKRV